MYGIDKPDSNQSDGPRLVESLRIGLRDAIAITVACALFALAFNALRSNGIALVQQSEYQILVPCPVTEGTVEAVSANALESETARTLVIDARAPVDYKTWHFAGAVNVSYDYLEPTVPETIKTIASSGAKRVVIYGDGDNPDSGKQLAKEIAGKGIRNIAYIKGGARSLREKAPSGGEP